MTTSTEAHFMLSNSFLNGEDPDFPELDTIEASFWSFHYRHPEVYEELRSLALRLRRQGRKHYGIKALYEIVRFQRTLSSRSCADWKLNNDYTCMYARLLMQQEPELNGFFRTRIRSKQPLARHQAA